ncbi:proteasome-type protease [Comamonas sp. Y33R10-2]|uniref:proteasome-type protease n=1 Tax=Comamonas sp. Y33R10-2 TaxID=2853257 RepID=UPI001C5CBE94|nr:proteasome-type protease [Comamonas sp. Y33R10-2]QXZ10326.1 proteasome-type protease [Comamonas sp. Y33R10-2]
MTYCVALKLNAGLVFLSDSRTNAGLDQISTFRKVMLYEQPGERFMVLQSAGNLSITQSVRELLESFQLHDATTDEMLTIWNVRSMFDAARVLGAAVRHVYEREGEALQRAGVDFNVSMILGGQIQGEGMRLFQVYSAGNFIEATGETPYFQIGESKYGKPVLDRVITSETPLDEAAKCALVSMDSTLKSNLSVGLPLDLIVYENNRFASDRIVCLDSDNPYLRMLHDSWGERLRNVFDSIEDPAWDGGQTDAPIRIHSPRAHPLVKVGAPTTAMQSTSSTGAGNIPPAALRQPPVPAQAGLSAANEYQRLQSNEEQARLQRQASLSNR